jgi:hypothetical protein
LLIEFLKLPAIIVVKNNTLKLILKPLMPLSVNMKNNKNQNYVA